MSSNDKGVVNIKGKNYKLIVQRVNEFRQAHPEFGVETEVLHHDEIRIVAQVRIFDEQGRIRGSGVAEEFRKTSRINQTSAMENCETSAFGRALASMGFGGDVSYASAEEVAGAINQQKQIEADEHLLAHANAVHKYFDDIVSIKENIANEDFISAGGAWFDLHNKASEEELQALKRARNNGGIWSTYETGLLRPDGEVSKVRASMMKQESTTKENAA